MNKKLFAAGFCVLAFAGTGFAGQGSQADVGRLIGLAQKFGSPAKQHPSPEQAYALLLGNGRFQKGYFSPDLVLASSNRLQNSNALGVYWMENPFPGEGLPQLEGARLLLVEATARPPKGAPFQKALFLTEKGKALAGLWTKKPVRGADAFRKCLVFAENPLLSQKWVSAFIKDASLRLAKATRGFKRS